MANKLLKISDVFGSTKQVLLNKSPFNICQTAFFAKPSYQERVKSELNIPDKPRRPLSPYFKFMSSIRPMLKAKHPDLKITELVKKAAIEWEKVDPEEKLKLETEYQTEKAQYAKQKLSYDAQLTVDQKEALKQARQADIEVKHKREIRKISRQMDKPKRPASAFVLFMQEQASKRGDKSFKEWQAEVVQAWNNLPAENKQIFKDKSKDLTKTYQKEIAKWEEKMIREGKTELVRSIAKLKTH